MMMMMMMMMMMLLQTLIILLCYQQEVYSFTILPTSSSDMSNKNPSNIRSFRLQQPRLFMTQQQQQQQQQQSSFLNTNIDNDNNNHNNKKKNGNKGLLQILNDEVYELLLDRLSEKRNQNNNNITTSTATKNTNMNMMNTTPNTIKSMSTDGLSKFHRNILASTTTRQRCVTGKYPLHITITENPTRKWLSSSSSSTSSSSSKTSLSSLSNSQMLVNGTSIDKSLASFDKYSWLDKNEQITLHQNHTLMSIELLAEIHVKKPGYVNVLSAASGGCLAEMEGNNLGLMYYGKDDDNGNEDNQQSSSNLSFYGMKRGQRKVNGIWKNRFKSSYEGQNLKQHLLQKQIQDKHKERMWITGFSLTKQSGELHYIDVENGRMGSVNKRSAASIRWPNEVNTVPRSVSTDNSIDQVIHEDALLVSDGFLVPGKDNGGLYVVSNPGHEYTEWNVCLAGGNGVDRLLTKLENKKKQNDNIQNNDDVEQTATIVADDDEGWFYHRAVWIDLTNDGRQSILTARAKRPSILKKGDNVNANDNTNVINGEEFQSATSKPTKAQLVWLERPKPDRYDDVTGTPLDKDGLVFDPFSPKHTPWKVRVLDEGPDVMFSLADLDTSDDTIEVFASQFFNKKVSLHSIQIGKEPKVVWKRIIDDRCGASFSSILANLDNSHSKNPIRRVIDNGSTVPTLQNDDGFSHLLVTSHECEFEDDTVSKPELNSRKKVSSSDKLSSSNSKDGDDDVKPNGQKLSSIDGGSLFSYRVPEGKDAWKTEPWIRSVIATGFRVRGQLGNMINPGAPGFW